MGSKAATYVDMMESACLLSDGKVAMTLPTPKTPAIEKGTTPIPASMKTATLTATPAETSSLLPASTAPFATISPKYQYDPKAAPPHPKKLRNVLKGNALV